MAEAGRLAGTRRWLTARRIDRVAIRTNEAGVGAASSMKTEGVLRG